MEVLEAIEKWSKAFGTKSVEVVERMEPDEDDERIATFVLRPSIHEFATHFNVDESQIEPIVIRRAASSCLVSMLRAGHRNVTVSVEGDMLFAVVDAEMDPRAGFTLV